jgi:hypothetical protein
MERFFGSLRREALDNCLLIGRGQIERILEGYVAFYNSQRRIKGSNSKSLDLLDRESRALPYPRPRC